MCAAVQFFDSPQMSVMCFDNASSWLANDPMKAIGSCFARHLKHSGESCPSHLVTQDELVEMNHLAIHLIHLSSIARIERQ